MLRHVRTAPKWLLVPGATVFAVSLAAYGLLKRGADPYDLRVYLMGGSAWMSGAPVFEAEMPTAWGPGHYTYPPVSLLGFGPLSEMPQGVVHGLMTLLSLAALWGVVWLVLRALGVQSGQGLVGLSLGITGACLWLQPVHDTIAQGQINLLLMLLVVVDLLRKGRSRGVLIGLACALKVTPGIFVVYLLITRQWRAAAVSAGTAVALTGLGWLVAPRDSATYWLQRFGDTAWMISPISPDDVQNQSLNGVILRLFDSPVLWAVLAGLVALGGLWVARRLDPIAGMLATAVTGLLISPLSWHEHWVWIVPIGVWLGVQAWRLAPRRPHLAGVMLPLGVFLTWPFEHSPGKVDALSILSPARSLWSEGVHNPVVALAGMAYVLAGLLFLAVLYGRKAHVLAEAKQDLAFPT